MTEELALLKREFERIKELGYMEATRDGTTSIEKTFEDLLGKKEDKEEEPDYHGIEIKTKRGYSTSYTTLFNATPKGKEEIETKRLVKTYGYPDSVLPKHKVLNVSVQTNCSTLVANRFLFKLEVNEKEKRVYLCICDKNMNFMEKDTYWSFSDLKIKLERKFKYLAFVKAWPKTVNGKTYYKYYDIDFYKLKSFDEFLHLLNDGKIRITFKIGVFRSGKRIGETRDRGTGFEIQELNLTNLFHLIKG